MYPDAVVLLFSDWHTLKKLVVLGVTTAQFTTSGCINSNFITGSSNCNSVANTWINTWLYCCKEVLVSGTHHFCQGVVLSTALQHLRCRSVPPYKAIPACSILPHQISWIYIWCRVQKAVHKVCFSILWFWSTVLNYPHSFPQNVPLYFVVYMIFFLIWYLIPFFCPSFVSLPELTFLPLLHFFSLPRLLSSNQLPSSYFFLQWFQFYYIQIWNWCFQIC